LMHTTYTKTTNAIIDKGISLFANKRDDRLLVLLAVVLVLVVSDRIIAIINT